MFEKRRDTIIRKSVVAPPDNMIWHKVDTLGNTMGIFKNTGENNWVPIAKNIEDFWTEYQFTLKTLNGESLLGEGDIVYDDTLNDSSTNAIQNKTMFNQIDTINNRIDSLSTDLTDHKNDADGRFDQINQKITDLSEENVDRKAEITAVESDVNDIKNRLKQYCECVINIESKKIGLFTYDEEPTLSEIYNKQTSVNLLDGNGNISNEASKLIANWINYPNRRMWAKTSSANIINIHPSILFNPNTNLPIMVSFVSCSFNTMNIYAIGEGIGIKYTYQNYA